MGSTYHADPSTGFALVGLDHFLAVSLCPGWNALFGFRASNARLNWIEKPAGALRTAFLWVGLTEWFLLWRQFSSPRSQPTSRMASDCSLGRNPNPASTVSLGQLVDCA